jgi:hypothetical protein
MQRGRAHGKYVVEPSLVRFAENRSRNRQMRGAGAPDLVRAAFEQGRKRMFE